MIDEIWQGVAGVIVGALMWFGMGDVLRFWREHRWRK